LQHLRLGFLALRLGELGGKAHYEDAASEFEWAAELEPTWPYPWYGLGRAELGIGDPTVTLLAGLRMMLGRDAPTRAAAAFARAVAVDPSFVRGLVDLAATALGQRVNARLEVALRALRLAAPTAAGRDPAVLLHRGRVERLAGDPDSALAAFLEYHTRGGKPGLALLEIARTRFLLGQVADGARAYYEGAGWDDPESVAEYRKDLEPLAADSVLRELDAQRGGRRVAYLRAFWRERAALSLRGEGERLAEHYRRLHRARVQYALGPWRRRYDYVERYRSGSRDFDDRGVIYIRHGEPTERATLPDPGADGTYGNESWRYAREDGDFIFHFHAREDPDDYRLVESLFDIPTSAPADLLASRSGFSPLYSRLTVAGGASRARYLAEERERGRRSIALGTTTDSHELRFAAPLTARTQVVALGGDDGRPRLQVAYAVPAGEVTPDSAGPAHVYSIRLRASVFDWRGEPVGAIDTTLTSTLPRPLAAGEHLTGRVGVPAIPGRLTYRVALEHAGGRGRVSPLDSASAPATDADGPALSDLVLGAARVGPRWQPTPDDTVYFNPLGRFDRGEPLRLYYEVYGLAPGTSYATRVVVSRQGGGFFRRLFGGRTVAVSLTFREPATAPVTRAHRSLDLRGLDPGRYRIEVRVTDHRGREVRRERAFDVRD
ncbi:MAG TPA: hypothetical protein VNK43_12675, partial [Gemmatimonadales bacterium]|nr:hypothetical protein [Gemmatimonadales bacterium]